MKTVAIVLSGGSGRRMNSDIPKQYMDLLSKPVIYYSLAAFDKSRVDEIVLVVGKGDIPYVRDEVLAPFAFGKKIIFTEGGRERADSVLSGLTACSDADYVLIHDGARPLVTPQMIDRMMEDVFREQACVAAVPVKDTLKYSDDGTYVDHTVDRKTLMAMQTPQAFRRSLLADAYRAMEERGEEASTAAITDDAMLIELFTDRKVFLSEGDYGNIKITTPEDLIMAEIFLQKRAI